MVIYGTAILSVCLLAGLIVGRLPGYWWGTGVDMGGVGIAMVLLVLVTERMRRSERLNGAVSAGIEFWSAIYVPVVVAMTASLDVKGAISGGWVAALAGVLAVGACFALVPLISGREKERSPEAGAWNE